MKKLMIAVAAVAMAAVASAATTDWTHFSLSPSGTFKNGYILSGTPGATPVEMSATLYLIEASYSYDSKTAQNAVIAAVGAGKSLESIAYKDASGNAVSINAVGGAFPTATTFDTTIAPGGTLSAFVAAIATDGNGDKFVFLSSANDYSALDTALTQPVSPAVGYSSKFRTGDTYSAVGWYSAVPEPTSGLLLLLGVAGLALRRRRA